MKYKSTRGQEKEYTSPQAIIKGIADDGGLFVPLDIPKLPFKVSDMIGKTYQEIATEVISCFFDEFNKEDLREWIDKAYDEKFDIEDVVKLKKIDTGHILELFHGKTSAFKDMALSLLPYLLLGALDYENFKDEKVCILAATSGDTGKAALEGFSNVNGTKIIVFYPHNGVSKVQERQMVTQRGENVKVVAIEGNFDKAQRGVKNIFNDKSIAEKVKGMGYRLSSANSINIGRLVPQIAYYVYSYIKLVEKGEILDGEPINVSVPTGNFGNILAAYYAREMGIPIAKFICASNINNVLTDFIRTGNYDSDRSFYLTNSPSMDILVSSNLERLLYHISNGDRNMVRELMDSLEEHGEYQLEDRFLQNMNFFYGGFATENEVEDVVEEVYRSCEYLMDTHTAVAYKVYQDYKKNMGDDTPTIIASTASPYKFAGSVSKAVGLEASKDEFECLLELEVFSGVKIPKEIKELKNLKVIHNEVIKPEEMSKKVLEFIED